MKLYIKQKDRSLLTLKCKHKNLYRDVTIWVHILRFLCYIVIFLDTNGNVYSFLSTKCVCIYLNSRSLLSKLIYAKTNTSSYCYGSLKLRKFSVNGNFGSFTKMLFSFLHHNFQRSIRNLDIHQRAKVCIYRMETLFIHKIIWIILNISQVMPI